MKLSFVSFFVLAVSLVGASAQESIVSGATEQLAKEDGDYWSRLLQETEGSLAPPLTPRPPSAAPPTPSPPSAPAPTGSAPITPPTAGLVPAPTPGGFETFSPTTEGTGDETFFPTTGGGDTSQPTTGGGNGTPAPGPSDETIAGILAGDDRFTTLVGLVVDAGLLPPLEGEGPLTVFAPTNAAFEALNLPPDTDPSVITDVLLYHVAGQEVLLEDGLSVVTLNGDTVVLTVTETETKVNDANIEETIPASNGIIYVIDAVLVPPPDVPAGRRH